MGEEVLFVVMCSVVVWVVWVGLVGVVLEGLSWLLCVVCIVISRVLVSSLVVSRNVVFGMCMWLVGVID